MRNAFKVIFRFAFPTIGWLALAIALFIWLMPPLFPWKYEELKRVPSPDGNYEFVITRADAGAMTRYQYGVSIVNKGMAFTPTAAVLDSGTIAPDAVTWTGNNELTIIQPPTTIRWYRPIWSFRRGHKIDHIIQIKLVVNYSKSVHQ